jgi:hypothetical protein
LTPQGAGVTDLQKSTTLDTLAQINGATIAANNIVDGVAARDRPLRVADADRRDHKRGQIGLFLRPADGLTRSVLLTYLD